MTAASKESQRYPVFDADSHVRAFGPLLHEHVGLVFYRLRGWIQ